jgi:hypothetical protein
MRSIIRVRINQLKPMKRTTRTLIVTAAITGILSGAAVRQSYADGSTNNSTNAPAPGKVAPARKTPKIQDCGGSNDCKGLGGCKTGDNSCKFKNSCKGKGGCTITAKDIQDWEKAHPN